MKDMLKTVRRPLITEKSTILREKDGTYCFRVHVNANKIEIARAIEKVFQKDKVKVAAGSDESCQRQGQADGPGDRQTPGLEEGLGHVGSRLG